MARSAAGRLARLAAGRAKALDDRVLTYNGRGGAWRLFQCLERAMAAWFNEAPTFSFPVDWATHLETINQGYASPVGGGDDHAVLAFESVEDHVDGNGWAALWLIQGAGVFYQEGVPHKMTAGDVVMFDDNAEHGFEAQEPCVGVNFPLGRPFELDELRMLVQKFNAPRRAPPRAPKP